MTIPARNAVRRIRILTLAVCLGSASLISLPNTAAADGCKMESISAYTALFEQSMKEKKGLTFYLKGQSIPAVVTKINDDGTVEGRNQTSDRIVIRIDRLDAVSLN